MHSRYVLAVFLTFFFQSAFTQRDSLNRLSFSGYAELYYSYDFSRPDDKEKPSFVYNHKRHNEINTNLILLKSIISMIIFERTLD